MGSDCAVAYLGDDTTDEAAFEVLKGNGLKVFVREDYRRTFVNVWIGPLPDDVCAFLIAWILACRMPV